MTEAEEKLLDAACEHWVSGRFGHLIAAVVNERAEKAKLPKPDDRCAACGNCYGMHISVQNQVALACPVSSNWPQYFEPMVEAQYAD